MSIEYSLKYLTELKGVIDRVDLGSFDACVNQIIETYVEGGQIFVAGNGGRAATASHFACDFNKGTCTDLKKRFKVICLNDSVSTMLAYANDISYESIFVEPLKNFMNRGDLFFGLSGSGNSPNVIRALQYANENGARTIGFTGFEGGELAHIAQTAVVVPSDDMQKIEDVHLMLVHIFMQIVQNRIG